MPDFPYLASVIVPVYNVEKYVRGCLESLVSQTLDFSEIEVVIINDGTKDSSEEICREFSDKYENVFLYSKENEGLSKTRNYGLDRARGKYIFFLDSDDKLRNDTIEAVTSFFETVYDETDLVTYRDTQYIQGRPKLIHYRYMTLNKSGVYDLNNPDNRFITQTRVNVCVKNLGENNPKFDFSPNFRHEDEEYCCKVVRNKMKSVTATEANTYTMSAIRTVLSQPHFHPIKFLKAQCFSMNSFLTALIVMFPCIFKVLYSTIFVGS